MSKILKKIILTNSQGTRVIDVTIPDGVKVSDANEITKGISKLSDSPNSTIDASTGSTAITPKGLYLVDSKIGELSNLNTKDKSNIVNAINEVKANPSGSGNNYVVTPIIITPTNGAIGQSTRINIVGGTYKNVFPDDARKHRVFEICKDNGFASNVIRGEVDADSWKVTQVLDPTTKYYVRIKDISASGYESLYSPIVNFTTGAKTGAISPTITLMGYDDSPTDIGSGLKIKGSEYQINEPDESDTHKATSWSIRNSITRANVWESLNDSTNKTQITVPNGTLQKSTKYTVSVIYHSTNFVDSAATEQDFTTSNDFGTVQAPIIEFNTDKNGLVMETPTFRGGVFSNTREPDTHAATEIKILLSRNSSVVWEKTTDSAATSITVPKGYLQVSNQYKVQLRYKGTNFGWSAWSEMSFTTADEFSRYNYIGIPGTKDFGVGLAPEDILPTIITGEYSGGSYRASLKTLPNTYTSGHFQYGLYGNTRESGGWSMPNDASLECVYLKYIPKFYVARLFDDSGNDLNETELNKLLPYVEVTIEQMKEAQRRAPKNSLVVAPANSFSNEADANTHGFILPRAFISKGIEKDGFFISNTKALVRNTSPKEFAIGLNELNNNHYSTLARANNSEQSVGINFRSCIDPFTRNETSFQQTSYLRLSTAFMWSAIACLSLVQGQYATSTDECAWYDPTLKTNFPKGINSTNKDVNDSSVTINIPMDNTKGSVFANNYAKTTHNGSETGITHVNGWLWEITLGFKNGPMILKKSVALSSINSTNVEDSSLYESIDANSLTHGTTGTTYYWGDSTNSSISWGTNNHARDLMCLFPKKNGHSNTGTIFGNDYTYWYNTYSVLRCSGSWSNGSDAGVFSRYLSVSWGNSYSHCGFRLAMYPNE